MAATLTTRRWFHPNLLAKNAEDLLLAKGQDGSFLVRPSQSTPGDFTLSARRGNEITHVKIQSTEEYYDLYGGEKFATLAELVEYYTDSQNILRETNGQVITFKLPLFVEEVTNERWYHGTLSGKESETLLQKAAPGSFLVRASIRSPGDYVVSVSINISSFVCRVDDSVTHIKINNTNGQFDVGDGKKFKTLDALVDHFKQAPMVETSGSVVRLKQPVNATRVISSHIHGRITDLMKVAAENFGKAGFWEEFEQLQQQEHKNLHSRKEGAKLENKKKNRYKNILPFDYTRVILKDGHPSIPGSDYINANYITDECGVVKYIATQGCVPDTVNDFWRMMWQENSRVIVMTTNEVERGRMKCQRYWPEVQKEMEFGPFLVVTVSEETKPHYILRELLIQKAAPEVFEGEDGVEEGYEELEEPRTIYHFHFTAWPDHGVPQDPAQVLAYLDDVNQQQMKLKELSLMPGPVVVHCSAGIGRTGTFIMVDLLLNKIAREGLDCEIDIQKSILSVRAQRSGMVQTEPQYKFIYLAISTHIQTLQARSRVGENYDNRSYPQLSSGKATGKSDEPEHLYTNLEFGRDQPNGSHTADPLLAQASAVPDQ